MLYKKILLFYDGKDLHICFCSCNAKSFENYYGCTSTVTVVHPQLHR